MNANAGAGGRLVPMVLFRRGVVFAMFGAMMVQKTYGNLADLLRRQDLYWSRVMVSGRRLLWAEARFRTSRRRWYHLAWLAPCLGWISGASFFSGIGAAALR